MRAHTAACDASKSCRGRIRLGHYRSSGFVTSPYVSHTERFILTSLPSAAMQATLLDWREPTKQFRYFLIA